MRPETCDFNCGCPSDAINVAEVDRFNREQSLFCALPSTKECLLLPCAAASATCTAGACARQP